MRRLGQTGAALTIAIGLVIGLMGGLMGGLIGACDDEGGEGAPAQDVELGSSAADVSQTPDTAAPAEAPEKQGQCGPCETDDDCVEGGVCIEDDRGALYCATQCLLSKNDCGPGFTCKLYGTDADQFACIPDYGSCTGDGEPCSPCADDADCAEGSRCVESIIDKVKSCYQECSGDGGCPEHHGCEEGLCLPFIANKNRQTCSTRQSGMCEPCSYGYDCQDGLVCGKGLGFCTMACEKEQGPQGTESTCPSGLFCPSGFCEAPNAYKCQGWLACAYAHECENGCEKGVCL